MKKSFKAFTLIELIVVMAIFGIIMAGIMQMFQPINEVYASTSVVSSQRAAEQGIATYIAENVRYANHIGVYQKQSSADAAMTAFLANGPTKVDGVTPLTKADLDVICINNTGNYHVSNSTAGQTFKGRLIRKNKGSPTGWNASQPFNYSGSGPSYMAMGEAYYGPADYYIRIDNFNSAGFDIIVDSDYYYTQSKTKMFKRADNDSNYTKTTVVLANTGTYAQGFTSVVDNSDTDPTVGTRTNQTHDTYIVYYIE